MATLGGTALTLADMAKEMDPDGTHASVAEVLMQSNPFWDDALFMPSNDLTSNRSSIRVGLPTVTVRKLNEGSAASKATTQQVTDGMSILDAWSNTDATLLDLAPSKEKLRFSQSKAFIEAMSQEAARLSIYGSVLTDESEFNGLQVRYNTLGDNVLDAGGATNNDHCSIYLVGWGEGKIFGIYPKNSMAGLQHHDIGERVLQTTAAGAANSINDANLRVVTDQYEWHLGIVAEDPRYCVRIANIETSDLFLNANTQAVSAATNIIKMMARAMHRIPNLNACRPVFYLPRSVFEAFDFIALSATMANVFRTEDVNGKTVMTFRGIPMKILDQLTYTEGEVS